MMRDARQFLLISAVFLGFLAPADAAQKDDSRLIVAEDTTQTTPPILPLPSTDGTATPAAPATPPPAAGSDSTTTPATPVQPPADPGQPPAAPDTGMGGDAGMGGDSGSQDPTDQGQDLTTTPDDQPDINAGEDGGEDMSLGEVPDIKTMELTTDIAKRALDTYVMVKDKYQDADLESYDNLQDFVDKNEQGKAFETDVKAAGFATVDDWNTAITSLSFAYTGVLDDPTGDIKLQIEDIQNDTSIAQDMKDKMIASLNAMIPSENNRKVVQELMADASYADKLKILDASEGE